jgi:hypothetical protein
MFVPAIAATPSPVMLLFVTVTVPVVVPKKIPASLELVIVLSRISALLMFVATIPAPVTPVTANPERIELFPSVTVSVIVVRPPLPEPAFRRRRFWLGCW